MKESDYLNATNLAKLRIAKDVLKDVLFMDKRREELRKEALRIVANLAIDLESLV